MPPQQAAFIIGIEHRCGTNFLSDLVSLHADCCRPTSIGEDFFLHHAQWLQLYAQRLHQTWSVPWRKSASPADIGAALGRGLLSILAQQASRPADCLVTKTPRADRISLFPWLFPQQPLLVLIRDGRSVVESAVRSFGWTYPKAIDRWARGARRILEFDRDQRQGKCRYLIVRYEDLVIDVATEMRRILTFLRLDPDRYDFEAAGALPVRGSSTLKSGGQKLHWEPVAKGQNFNPLNRAQHWTASQHRRFLSKAGGLQQLLGYDCDGSSQTGLVGSLLTRLSDLRWQRKIARLGLLPLQRQPACLAGEESESTRVLPFRQQRRAA